MLTRNMVFSDFKKETGTIKQVKLPPTIPVSHKGTGLSSAVWLLIQLPVNEPGKSP